MRTPSCSFQSSSSPRAGCNPRPVVGRQCPLSLFQSSSSPRAGCNQCRRSRGGACGAVSILIQPEGRMQRASTLAQRPVVVHVSILIQPEGRMQQPRQHQGNRVQHDVSILIQPEGRMQRPQLLTRPFGIVFQSSSSPRAGCNRCERASGPTRPSWCFNPHPARGPDATAIHDAGPVTAGLFQSSSSPRAGCNAARCSTSCAGSCSFNPHPARGPDATRRTRW